MTYTWIVVSMVITNLVFLSMIFALNKDVNMLKGTINRHQSDIKELFHDVDEIKSSIIHNTK